jgi:hydrogenase nickel incorporation protein HypA/HybF
MHELSLAQGVIEILVQEARRHDITRIERVRLRVGVLRAVVPELLQTGLEFVSQGTPAEGAQAIIEQVQGRARCRACGLEFEVSDPWIVCPGCEQVGGEILAGQELQIVDFEGD